MVELRRGDRLIARFPVISAQRHAQINAPPRLTYLCTTTFLFTVVFIMTLLTLCDLACSCMFIDA